MFGNLALISDDSQIKGGSPQGVIATIDETSQDGLQSTRSGCLCRKRLLGA